MNNSQINFKARVRSFKYAFNGIWILISSQPNAWIHALATIAVIVSGVYFKLNESEWCLIIIAAISVWVAEAFNTALEFLTDVASPDFHPLAGKAKDVAAGAVLIAAIGSALLGLIIFVPHLLEKIK
jgi:diacylglycerol kinase